MDGQPEIWRYTCTACGLLVRVAHRASGLEVAACACGAEITEELEPQVEPGGND